MTDKEKRMIADEANMIVSGYSYTKSDKGIEIVNLNMLEPHTMVINLDGKMIESSMDPIEQSVAIDLWNSNKELKIHKKELQADV